MGFALRAWAACAVAVLFLATPRPANAVLPRDIQARILAVHNATRAEVGVRPLKWDDRLAADAEQWAHHLAQINVLQHWGSHGEPNNGEGENLWMGSRGAYSVEQMTGAWAGEKIAFRRARKWEDEFASVGHYTQMVWRSTTAVGCAIAINVQFDFLVCRYAPQGNFIGRSPY